MNNESAEDKIEASHASIIEFNELTERLVPAHPLREARVAEYKLADGRRIWFSLGEPNPDEGGFFAESNHYYVEMTIYETPAAGGKMGTIYKLWPDWRMSWDIIPAQSSTVKNKTKVSDDRIFMTESELQKINDILRNVNPEDRTPDQG